MWRRTASGSATAAGKWWASITFQNLGTRQVNVQSGHNPQSISFDRTQAERRAGWVNFLLRMEREIHAWRQHPSRLRFTLATEREQGMQFDWRAISGPALTAATALIAIVVDRNFVTVPNPAPLFVCIVALASSLGGLASGMTTAATAVASSALFFFNHRATPGYDTSDLVRLLMLAMTAAGTAAITGLLRKRLMDAFAWERKHHTTAERLSAALGQVHLGIVLLDCDTRAEFINRAFRDYFSLPDE